MGYKLNIIKRIFLYQFLISFSLLRLPEAFRYYKDFQKKLKILVKSLNLNPSILEYQFQDKEIDYKIFLISLIVLSCFSILNIKFFQFLTGIMCIIVGLIYHNPIDELKELFTSKEKITIDNFQNYLPSLDFIIFLCIGLGMIAHSFQYSIKKNIKEKDKEIPNPKEQNIEIPEIKNKNEKKKKKE